MKRIQHCFWRHYGRFLILCSAVVFLDQISKYWVITHIPFGTYQNPILVIKPFFYLVHIPNSGAAWGLFPSFTNLFILIAILVLVMIVSFRKKLMDRPSMEYTFGLLCGGVLGNLIDRIRFGYVTDFLDIHLRIYRWPAFNFADSSITIGITLYFLGTLYASCAKKGSSPS